MRLKNLLNRCAALRAETGSFGHVLLLPTAFAAAAFCALGLFCTAVLAELTLIYSAAGAGPASCIGRFRLAALRAEFAGSLGAAGALPSICRWLRLRLLCSAVRAE